MADPRATSRRLSPPPSLVWDGVIASGLKEDLGTAGDLTTDSIVPEDALAAADMVARSQGVIAGLDVVSQVFAQLDRQVEIERLVEDGDRVEAGSRIARLEGPARALLTGERTALNLLSRLSGIASATRALVDAIAGVGDRSATPQVVCTRKTTPGLRALEKYAVRAGGGSNHRFGLHDAVLIKDNHIAFAGGIEPAIERVRRRVGHLVKVEIEVDDLEQLERALAQGVDAVLLDNMSLEQLRQAVRLCAGKVITEASGGIRPETARDIAATGVDLLSVGWLTHSAPALDIGLDWSG